MGTQIELFIFYLYKQKIKNIMIEDIIDVNVDVLKTLKEVYLKKEKSTERKHIIELINALAVEKGYIEIFPYVNLRTVNVILNNEHDCLELVENRLKTVEEGTMAMEYCYSMIIKNRYNYNTYSIELNDVNMVNGETWDDYVANETGLLFVIKKVRAEKEVKVTYVVIDD